MLKQAQKLQEDMENAQKKLESSEMEVSAAGGAVKAKISGLTEFKSFKISKELLAEGHHAVEIAVLAAANEAVAAAKKKHEEAMRFITAGLDLPDMSDLDLDLGLEDKGPKRRTGDLQV